MSWDKDRGTHVLWRLLVIARGSLRSTVSFGFAVFLTCCSCSRALLLLILLQL